MNRHSRKLIALLSFATLPFGTVACSNGSSPTEPAFSDEEALVSTSTDGVSLTVEESKGRGRGRGSDDNGGDNRGGRGGKGGKGGKGGRDDRGGRGGQDDTPRAGREFEGAVASVGGSSLTLANGTRIVVNGQTQWIARGDLHSLDQIAGSVAANRPTRVEGRGNRQADGSILALTIKAEVDN